MIRTHVKTKLKEVFEKNPFTFTPDEIDTLKELTTDTKRVNKILSETWNNDDYHEIIEKSI